MIGKRKRGASNLRDLEGERKRLLAVLEEKNKMPLLAPVYAGEGKEARGGRGGERSLVVSSPMYGRRGRGSLRSALKEESRDTVAGETRGGSCVCTTGGGGGGGTASPSRGRRREPAGRLLANRGRRKRVP